MTTSDSRRIRNIRLKASRRELIRRGAIVLEDAFRTATLTGSGGRLLVVRSFDVGRFHARQNSTNVARLIEQRFRNLEQTAVYAGTPNAERFEAVYFRDETEPYVLLAVRLGRGETPRGWFWPLAAPPWTPNMERAAALPTLLVRTLQLSPRTTAGIHLIRGLQQHRVIDPLLAALDPGDGDVLLRAFGWPSSIDPVIQGTATAPGSPLEPTPQWEATLRRWIATWGPSDSRTRWLSTVALVAEKPARLLARDIVQRAQRTVRRLVSDSLPAGLDTARLRSEDDDRKAVNLSNTEIAPVDQVAGKPTDPSAGKVAAERDVDDEPAVPDRVDLPDRAETSAQRGMVDRIDGHDQTVDFVREQVAHGERDDPIGNKIQGEERLDSSGQQHIRRLNVAEQRTTGSIRRQADDTTADANQQDPPLHTDYAGLFFSVTVLSYLGIEEFLEADPDWIEAEFPVRFFLELCSRLGIADDDPVRLAITASDGSLPDEPGRFAAPTAWHSTWWDGERWYPSDGRYPRHRVIEVWIEAARRWCLGLVEMELDEIVRRPGRVSWTPTHIDVVFDLRQADVRIRKSGLDLNPGWVPWLGRVINYHYDYGVQRG